MPHVLWELQGTQVLKTEAAADGKAHKTLELEKAGFMSPKDYDKQVADLVGFIVWMGEPTAGLRKSLGMGVLVFLVVLFGLSYALKREFWKDIH